MKTQKKQQQTKTSKKPRKAKKLTVIPYTRIADPNNIASREQQEKELREFCLKENLDIVKIIHDTGSGTNFEKRKEFKQLLQQLKSGELKADFLLFTDLTRFSRNYESLYNMGIILQYLGITPKCITTTDVELLVSKYPFHKKIFGK
jgi:DNA invertase Pin-like site-specific DNA recombinase